MVGGKSTTVAFEEERTVVLNDSEQMFAVTNGLIMVENQDGKARSIFVNEAQHESVEAMTARKPSDEVAEETKDDKFDANAAEQKVL